MTEIPQYVYYVIGSVVVANIATIGSVLFTAAKFVWWMSKLDSRIEHVEKAHAKDLNAAHEKIRELNSEFKELKQSIYEKD